MSRVFYLPQHRTPSTRHPLALSRMRLTGCWVPADESWYWKFLGSPRLNPQPSVQQAGILPQDHSATTTMTLRSNLLHRRKQLNFLRAIIVLIQPVGRIDSYTWITEMPFGLFQYPPSLVSPILHVMKLSWSAEMKPICGLVSAFKAAVPYRIALITAVEWYGFYL